MRTLPSQHLNGINDRSWTEDAVTTANAGQRPVVFKFQNLGPITSAEIELGDLTIIAGRNNTGKTYLAYTLYGLLKEWRNWPRLLYGHSDGESGSAWRDQITTTVQVVRQVSERGEASVPADRRTIARERRTVMEALAHWYARDELDSVFSTATGTFANASVNIELGDECPELREPVTERLRSGELLSIQYDGRTISAGVSDPGRRGGRGHSLRDDIASLYLRFLFPELPSDPCVLSAERLGISLFYKDLDFTKNKLVDLLQKIGDRRQKEDYSPFVLIEAATGRYALPIKDNINYTRRVSDLRKQKSEIHGDGLFNDVRAMMNGYYSASNDDIEFRSVARGERRFTIPLHLASSSARGLSDLYFFLRHVARRNHLLIIDEPESHLDTSNQILLARLLARVVRTGVKVLVSTHSDYLIKEMNNLIMLNSNFEKKTEVVKRLNYEESDYLDPGRIRAYIAKENTLTRCEIDKFGIDMPNFDETINSINSVANELSAWLSVEARE